MTRVVAGLNDYRYEASLHVQHPTIDVDAISDAIPFSPKRTCRIGDRRRTLGGDLRDGVYDISHWHAELTPGDGMDLPEFLDDLIVQLGSSTQFLADISATGGECDVFVGLFVNRCCDFILPPSVLGSLASAGIGLRLDYYTADGSVPGNG